MRNFYLSSISGKSGIAKYSKDFYELVLKESGYIFVDSSDDLSSIFTKISSRDHVHIEIGIFQKREIEILLLMLKAKYSNISITMHDAPILKYPLKEFENVILENFSKLYDRILGFKNSKPYIEKIKSIYILSQRGVLETKNIYNSNNIYFLPHIIHPAHLEKKIGLVNKHFIYFGFIGRNKGIEYALKVHQAMIKIYPDINFYIVGTALGREMQYYNYLKNKFTKNVHFLGYLSESELQSLAEKASFAFSLFKDYKFFYPTSGSILHNLSKGNIVLTNHVNSISEIVTDRFNGIYLSGNLKKDVELVVELFNSPAVLDNIRTNTISYLSSKHFPEIVKAHYFAGQPKNEL